MELTPISETEFRKKLKGCGILLLRDIIAAVLFQNSQIRIKSSSCILP